MIQTRTMDGTIAVAGRENASVTRTMGRKGYDPSDGQRFLAGLLFTFGSEPYLWAEPVRRREGEGVTMSEFHPRWALERKFGWIEPWNLVSVHETEQRALSQAVYMPGRVKYRARRLSLAEIEKHQRLERP